MRLRGERAQCGFLFGGLGIPNRSSSDLLPDEMYQKLMSPLFAQWAEEVAHKRSIIANHRKDFARHCTDGICEELFAGSKCHLAGVYAKLG
eukprot:COSAG02_NODE_116_length_35392_cov_302.150001_10_plen_91_part_00